MYQRFVLYLIAKELVTNGHRASGPSLERIRENALRNRTRVHILRTASSGEAIQRVSAPL